VAVVATLADAKEQKVYYEYAGESDEMIGTRNARVLLEHGADVSARDDSHSTPLHLVSYMGNGKAVGLLIRHGADVNAQDERHRTPLHRVVSSCLTLRREVVHLLLCDGANVGAKDDKGRTPFQIASSRGLHEIAESMQLHQ
jgi:ankyrin repeat protein